MKKKFQKKYIIIFICLIDTALLFYNKYAANGLSFADFQFFLFGNLFELLITFFLISGIIVSLFLKRRGENINYAFIFSLMLLSLLLIFVATISNLLNINFGDDYILNYPLNKVLIGMFLITNKILHLYLLFYIWLSLLSNKTRILVKPLFYSCILVIMLLLYSFISTQTFSGRQVEHESRIYDVAIVLGAAVWSSNQPSPVFQGRIEKAVELYKLGLVKNIQFTGGNAPGEIPEAEAALRYITKFNIDSSDIFTEIESSTTSDQIKFIKFEITKNFKYKNILIISDQFHLRRVLEICKFFNIEAAGVSSDYEIKWHDLIFYRVRESVGLLLFWFFAI